MTESLTLTATLVDGTALSSTATLTASILLRSCEANPLTPPSLAPGNTVTVARYGADNSITIDSSASTVDPSGKCGTFAFSHSFGSIDSAELSTSGDSHALTIKP